MKTSVSPVRKELKYPLVRVWCLREREREREREGGEKRKRRREREACY